jgi:hypothetical protein
VPRQHWHAALAFKNLKFIWPPGNIFSTVLAVMGGSAAKGKYLLALECKYLAPHQMEDIFANPVDFTTVP